MVLTSVSKQPVFDGLYSLAACVGARDANPPAWLKLPAPTSVRVRLCRAGGGGQPPRERHQDAVIRPHRVRSAHDPRARRQLQGERALLASCFHLGSLHGNTQCFLSVQAMARDEKNYYQDTPKQIRRKVAEYKRCHPEQFNAFLESLGVPRPMGL